MPTSPSSSTPPTSNPPSASNRPRPSRRVSDLVSHFESASTIRPAVGIGATSLPSSSGRRATSFLPPLPAAPDDAAATTSRVRQHVRRFSADVAASAGVSSPSSGSATAASSRKASTATSKSSTSTVPSPAVVTGNLDEMDWTPRRTAPPPPSPATEPTTPQPPQSAAPSSPPRPPPAVARSAAKTAAAATVFVPAVVSSNGGEGKTRMEVKPPVAKKAGSEAEKPVTGTKVALRVVKTRSREAEEKPEPLARPSPPPPVPSQPPRPALADSRRPSIAFVDPAPLSLPARVEHRSSSAPTPPSPTKPAKRPAPARAKTASSLAPPPLSSGPSSKPKRPVLTRASTSGRTSFSLPTAPSSRLTIPPTPSTAYSPSAGGSSCATRSLPAWALFARDADPLVLPDLDRVLQELGGQAELVGMPEDVRGEEGEDEEGDEKGRKRKGGGGKGDEEWDLQSLREKKREREEELVEDAGQQEEGDDDVFGSRYEREAWEKWLRGPSPSCWTRLKHFLLRRSHSSIAAASAAARKQRALIFPPFHLLPPSLTVTDLKANRHAPPPLVSFQSLVLKAANGLLGAAGSSYGLKMTSLEGLRDLMQMVTLLVTAGSPTLTPLTAGSSTVEGTLGTHSSPTLFRTLFVTVPSFLSLDFVSAFGQALVLLFVLTAVTLGALYELYRFTGGWHGPSGKLGRGKLDLEEGYDREDLRERKRSWRDSYGWKVVVTFWCSSFYLPLSKLAISALVWSSDFWPPTSASNASLGAAAVGVCYRTSAASGAWNWAYLVLPVAVLLIAVLSLWLPWRSWQVVKREAPRVDGFTDLGERRRDKNGEYERLLDADPSPFNFLYREYRRPWASFRSLYLLFKLANVLLVVLISSDNCAFRSFSSTYLSIVRQGCLLALLALFFGLSAWSAPYIDTVSNSSDIASRFGFSILAMLGLLEALGMGGTEGAVITTNVVVYGFNIYFALISTSIAQRLVKRVQRRLDFSIDIFSPRIDLSKHLSRRIWQESLAALLLCSPDFAMPSKQKLGFTKDDDLPPYLLGFQGTVGERFVENLKILREIGLDAYSDAVSYRDLDPSSRVLQLRRIIQERFAGPDAFYHPPDLDLPVTSFFGRLDIVPFPFVAVFRYDQQPTQPLHLVAIDDLERFVQQNEAAAVAGRRKVRLALRALEGQLVYAPHVEVRGLGAAGGAGRTEVERHIHYTFARLRIDRNSNFLWRGINCSSGFDVKLEYGDGVGPDRDGRPTKHQQLVLPGSDFGIFDDFSLNQPLATLFRQNRLIIDQRLRDVEDKLQEHRDFFRFEAEKKHRILTHSFLLSIFAEDRLSTCDLDFLLRTTEHNPKVRSLARRYKALFERLEGRMDAVKANDVRGWWYLVWDDLWRRNADVLKRKPEEFSPHYRSSICYHPMSRSDLESFLHNRGFSTGRNAYFHQGLLNQLYFYLDEQIFGTTSRAIPIHLGPSPSTRIPYSDLSRLLPHDHQPSLSVGNDASRTARKVSNGTLLSRFTAETGSGTQEDEDAIRQRPAFLFEEAFSRPAPPFRSGSRWAWVRFHLGERAREKGMKWLGLRVVVADWRPSEEEGVWLELRKGRSGGWEVPRSAKREKIEEEEEDCVV